LDFYLFFTKAATKKKCACLIIEIVKNKKDCLTNGRVGVIIRKDVKVRSIAFCGRRTKRQEKAMQENRKRLLTSLYRICFSVLTAVVGLLFIVQAWSIFRSAERGAYTVSRISEHFSQIVVPVILWGVALLVNIVLGWIYPDEKEKVKPYFTAEERIARLEKRLPKDAESLRLGKMDVLGKVVGWGSLAFAAVALTVSLVYLFDKSYSPVLPEPFFLEMRGLSDRLVRVLLWCGGGVALVVAAVIFNDYLGRKKETAIKREIAENAKNKIVVSPVKETEKNRSDKAARIVVWVFRGVVGTVGIVLLIWGICNGGMADVLKKAINICTQCIGLG